MNGRGTALQRVNAVGAAAAVLWVLGVGAVGPALAQGSPLRAQTRSEWPGRPREHRRRRGRVDRRIPLPGRAVRPPRGVAREGLLLRGGDPRATRVATAAHCLIGERGQRSQRRRNRGARGLHLPRTGRPRERAGPGGVDHRRSGVQHLPPATTTWACCGSRARCGAARPRRSTAATRSPRWRSTRRTRRTRGPRRRPPARRPRSRRRRSAAGGI